MFEKIQFGQKRQINGLSKAMSIVDKYIGPGMSTRELDYGYGKAYTQIRLEYINGEISEMETNAALTTLNNQHDKLRRAAMLAEMFQQFT